MKKINLFLGIALTALLVISCGSSKETAQAPQTQPASVPCPNCTATSTHFKYLAQGVADSEYDIQTVRTLTEENARAGLQAMIETAVKRSVDQFTQQHRDGENVKTIAKNTVQSLNIINAKIKGTPVTCWDARPSTMTPGKISVYVCVEYNAEDIYNTVVETMSADTELKIDFKQEQYKDDFYRALEEYSNTK